MHVKTIVTEQANQSHHFQTFSRHSSYRLVRSLLYVHSRLHLQKRGACLAEKICRTSSTPRATSTVGCRERRRIRELEKWNSTCIQHYHIGENNFHVLNLTHTNTTRGFSVAVRHLETHAICTLHVFTSSAPFSCRHLPLAGV